MSHISVGKQGEKIAIDYLIEKGYLILERNYVSGKNEVDIIAKNKGEIIFIEVKTRTSSYYISPEQAVNRNKQRSIIRVANSYILRNRIDKEARFDIISIILEANGHEINHIERAFEPMPY